jgi:hypothetical protein
MYIEKYRTEILYNYTKQNNADARVYRYKMCILEHTMWDTKSNGTTLKEKIYIYVNRIENNMYIEKYRAHGNICTK